MGPCRYLTPTTHILDILPSQDSQDILPIPTTLLVTLDILSGTQYHNHHILKHITQDILSQDFLPHSHHIPILSLVTLLHNRHTQPYLHILQHSQDTLRASQATLLTNQATLLASQATLLASQGTLQVSQATLLSSQDILLFNLDFLNQLPLQPPVARVLLHLLS